MRNEIDTSKCKQCGKELEGLEYIMSRYNRCLDCCRKNHKQVAKEVKE